MKNTSYLVAVSSALVAATQMYAAAVSGDISFAGSTVLNANIPLATAFTSFSGVTVGLGTQSGTFSGTDGVSVAFTPFTFESGGLPATVGSPFTLWSFTTGGSTYDFRVSSIDTVNKSTSAGVTSLLIAGSGTAQVTGFTDTAATFTIQLSGKKATVTFSSYAAPVPEPSSWALVSGLGLAGFAFYRRARK